ncbi:N-acetyltransferase [Galdieria sulphuraria]|uniref:N-acetyltransferase n=1 Tax=Galdieria sulphuraria TaxID=130081 RepID=M2Y1S8_GALSU|nr:N-acetyltransferase [Galdieria sulphuraria]EME29769.1 N-acetyltransferase [Galdieria sulphuraria]|eukprot:XP_005706289.1 N-acetyltransferase [Galdieria sulphuraria]
MQKEHLSCKAYFQLNQTGQLHATRIKGTSELFSQSLQTKQKASYYRDYPEPRCLGLLDSLNFQRKVLFIHFPKLTSIRQSKSGWQRICCSSVSTVSTDDPGRSSKSIEGSNRVWLELRQAKPEELVAVAEIRRVAFTPEETFSTHLTEEKRQQDIYYAILERLKRPGTCCLVVVKRTSTNNENRSSVEEAKEVDIHEEEIVLGTCDVSIHDAESGLRVRTSNFKRVVYVSSMAVRPEYRRKGVAKRLLNGVLDIARLEKIDDVFLHVDETNTPAVRLYYSFGFQRFPLPIPMWLRTMARHDHVLLWQDLRRVEE